MRFGAVPLEQAEGAILAHRLKLPDGVIRKGHRLSRADLERARRAGCDELVVAIPEPGDVGEDEAARRIADALTAPDLECDPPFTGRVNLRARRAGLVELDSARICALNAVDEAVTVATLPPWSAVRPGQLVATVKIIPFAVPEGIVQRVVEMIRNAPPLRLRPFAPFAARLIQTLLPGAASRLLDKTVVVLRERLARLEGRLLSDNRCPHEVEPLAAAIRAAAAQGFDMLCILGASATADRRDVIPAALERAGGRVRRFGIPVDPGNLLLLGELEGRPVLALPGSARSPKSSGVDWVMERLAAGLELGAADFAAMGVGGLLGEIPSRPQPRELRPRGGEERRVAAIVLAAGRGRRMGARSKLLLEIDGKPMIRHVVESLLASRARPVIVVTGFAREAVVAALEHLDVTLVFNPDFDAGLSTSLKRGLDAVPGACDGVIVCLGDMPRVTAPVVDRLIEAFDPEAGGGIVVPTCGGLRGHPVLFGRAFFEAMRAIAGDTGARQVVESFPEAVVEIELGDPAVLLDVDTPAELERAQRTER